MTVEKSNKRTVADLLFNELEGPAQQLAASLFRGPPILDYSSLASRADARLIAAEMANRCIVMNQRGEIKSIELSVDFLTGLASAGNQGRLDRPEAVRAAKRENGFAPHSMSKISVAAIPSPSEHGAFIYMPAMASLTIGISDVSKSSMKLRKRGTGSRVAEFSSGLSFDRIRHENPTNEEVQQLIRAFVKIDRTLCIAANKLPSVAGEDEMRENTRFVRELGLLQLLSQIPVDKGYFGHGVGVDLLEHALVGPMNRAKKVRKNKDSLSRAKALNVWWCDTVDNPGKRNKPPLVIL